MSRAAIAETGTAGHEVSRLRIKTKLVCWLLSCDEKTLGKWERECPDLFAPVRRQRNGNIYWPEQVRIMRIVMDGLRTTKEGAELWERTKEAIDNDTYRDAGDKTRTRR